MKNDSTQNEVWQSLVCSRQLLHYYEELGRRMGRGHLYTRLVLLGVAVTGGGVLLAEHPPKTWQEFVFATIVITAVVISFVLNFGKKAIVAQFVALECTKVQKSYRFLFNRVRTSNAEESEIQREDQRLAERLTEAIGWGAVAGLWEDANLKKECREKTETELKKRYPDQND